MQGLTIELTQGLLLGVVLSAIASTLAMWVLYITIKAAVRDGIKESGLGDTWGKTVAQAELVQAMSKLPEMRAD